MIECHGIQSNDNVVLHKRKAWHGLGTVVSEAPSPFAAAKLAGLNWDVLESANVEGTFRFPDPVVSPESMTDDAPETDHYVSLPTVKMLCRSDDMSGLAIVGNGYEPFQNRELADLCYQVSDALHTEQVAGEQPKVTVESAGSLWGGRKVWFLLHASKFMLRGDDVNHEYFLLSNSHDGSSSLTLTPTYIRVVCNNTYTLANSMRSAGKISLRHTRNIRESIPKVLRMLRDGTPQRQDYKDNCARLASRNIGEREAQEIFAGIYMRIHGDPSKAGRNADTDDKRMRACERATNKMYDRLTEWQKSWEAEMVATEQPATRWTAFNAVTNYYDYAPVQMRGRVSQDTIADKRLDDNLWGSSADRKRVAFDAFISA